MYLYEKAATPTLAPRVTRRPGPERIPSSRRGGLPVVEHPEERDVPKVDTVAPSPDPDGHGMLQQWSERRVSVDKKFNTAPATATPVAQSLEKSVKRLRLETQKGSKE